MINWPLLAKYSIGLAAIAFFIWFAADIYAQAKKNIIAKEALQRERLQLDFQKRQLTAIQAANAELFAKWRSAIEQSHAVADAQQDAINDIIKKAGDRPCLDRSIVRVLNGAHHE